MHVLRMLITGIDYQKLELIGAKELSDSLIKQEVHLCKNAFLKEIESDEDYVHNLFNYKG